MMEHLELQELLELRHWLTVMLLLQNLQNVMIVTHVTPKHQPWMQIFLALLEQDIHSHHQLHQPLAMIMMESIHYTLDRFIIILHRVQYMFGMV